MRSSPGLAMRSVAIVHDDDRTPGGEWHPIGVLRPLVPATMPPAEARSALDEMERKGTFEPRLAADQRKAPKRLSSSLEDGKAPESSGRKRGKGDNIKFL